LVGYEGIVRVVQTRLIVIGLSKKCEGVLFQPRDDINWVMVE